MSREYMIFNKHDKLRRYLTLMTAHESETLFLYEPIKSETYSCILHR